MAFSALNSNRYRKNVFPSPSYACGGFESAYHFYFICPIYTVTREIYLDGFLILHVNHATQKLLFGKDSSTDIETKALFCSSN